MNIYQIDQALLGCVDGETGEVLDMEALEALQMERNQKIENVALWIKNLKAESEAIKDEERKLVDRRKAKESKIKSMSAYIQNAIQGSKFETARVCCSMRNNPQSVDITDQDSLLKWLESEHEDCLSYAKPTIKKTEVKALIEQGIDVPGAELIRTQSLNIK